MALTQEQFLQRCYDKHGDKFDYSETVYIRIKDKTKFICREHGEFYQTAETHLEATFACPTCDPSRKSNTKEFVEKANKIHGDKYDYSEVEYVTAIELSLIHI